MIGCMLVYPLLIKVVPMIRCMWVRSLPAAFLSQNPSFSIRPLSLTRKLPPRGSPKKSRRRGQRVPPPPQPAAKSATKLGHIIQVEIPKDIFCRESKERKKVAKGTRSVPRAIEKMSKIPPPLLLSPNEWVVYERDSILWVGYPVRHTQSKWKVLKVKKRNVICDKLNAGLMSNWVTASHNKSCNLVSFAQTNYFPVSEVTLSVNS